MAKYLAPEGYLYDEKSGLYYSQNIEVDLDGNRTQNVLWFNAETGEYTKAQYALSPVPAAPPLPEEFLETPTPPEAVSVATPVTPETAPTAAPAATPVAPVTSTVAPTPTPAVPTVAPAATPVTPTATPSAQTSTATSGSKSTTSAPAKIPAKKKNSWVPAVIAGVAVVLLLGGAFFALKKFGYEIQDKLPFMEPVVSFVNGGAHYGPIGGHNDDRDDDRDDERNDERDDRDEDAQNVADATDDTNVTENSSNDVTQNASSTDASSETANTPNEDTSAENSDSIAEEIVESEQGYDGVLPEELTEDEALQIANDLGIVSGTFVPESEYSPNGKYIGYIFGNYFATPTTDFDKEFFETDGYPSIHIFTDGTYEMFCQTGGDCWWNSGTYSVSEPQSEMDDVTVYLYGAIDSGGNTVTAEFVFTDAQDYPVLVTEGLGYMGEEGAPYWFERDY